jgi:predicted Zn-dependent peptidase
MFKKTTLKNGLRIITVPQKESQAVTILVLVGTGSKYEKKEINGISHFLEHMFFKGTKKRPSKLKVAETLDKVGGMYNAFTSQEYTGYFAKVEASYFELALDWISDIYLNSLLPKKEIERERGVIIEEINMKYDDPMIYVNYLWLQLLYGDQPAGWDVKGTKETVKKIDRKKLLDYLKSQYKAENTVICVAGKIKEEEVLKKVKKYFAKIRVGRPLSKPKVIEEQKKPSLLLQFKETDQTHLCLGVRAFNLFHPQKYAQEVLAAILGGMMSSRLFLKIRDELGLAYYINTSAEADTDCGFLVTHAGINNQKVNLGICEILKEYKKISQKKVSKEELKKAKDYLKGHLALILETSDAKASFYGMQELLKKEILTEKQIFERIDKVTQEDILKVAKEIFLSEKLNLALIGPFKEKERFENLLKF